MTNHAAPPPEAAGSTPLPDSSVTAKTPHAASGAAPAEFADAASLFSFSGDFPQCPPEPSRWKGIPDPPSEPDIAALRSLILQREIALLDRIRARLDDPKCQAAEVGNVLAEAMLLRAGKDDKLAVALEPMVEPLFMEALRRNPREFADTLFPLMGPAIRRAIGEAIRGMLDNFRKAVEMSFTTTGWRWRFQAWRTGRPFSEVVLLNTLVYRVEQIFLIHSPSGLLLAHEAVEDIAAQDADMVSAMLTAIQDFARDCFSGKQTADLDTLQFDEFTILLEKNSLVYIACVVRGTPPINFREKLRDSLTHITTDCYDSLLHFNGDIEPFIFARPHLERCMAARFVGEDKPLPLWAKITPLLLILLPVLSFGTHLYLSEQEEKAVFEQAEAARMELAAWRAEMESGLTALLSRPGLAVLHVHKPDSAPWTIYCLKDDLGPEPAEVLKEAKREPELYRISSAPYISLEPEIVAKRAVRKLSPPEGAALRFDGQSGTLYFEGTAELDWINEAKQEAHALPGVNRVDTSGISDPHVAELQRLVTEVEAVSIHFPSNKDTPAAADMPALEQALDNLTALEQLAREMGISVSLTVYGHADTSGSAKLNYELSKARAGTLAAMLYMRGSSMPVSLYGMGADYAARKNADSPDAAQQDRRIELRVNLNKAPDAAVDLLRAQ